ncbi:MAG: hypothetical protein EOP05_08190, partial [Proteobacteria bacterium]
MRMENSIFKFAAFLFLLPLALGLSACSSKTSDSKISLSFPDWDAARTAAITKANSKAGSSALALSTDQTKIQIIAINITSADIAAPITFTWHRKEDSNELAPTTFDFVV